MHHLLGCAHDAWHHALSSTSANETVRATVQTSKAAAPTAAPKESPCERLSSFAVLVMS